MSDYPSLLLENAVNELSRLPGIGKKTALRLALFMLRQEKSRTDSLANSILRMREGIQLCQRCFNISDHDVCSICANPRRDENTLCIVEDMRDVMAVERTAAFNGLYHVLGGVINPIEGIGPNDLTITQLINRLNQEVFQEIILALPATVEGDTTSYYLYRQIKPGKIKITSISKGVAIGDSLEYADEVTLGRSILNRTIFDL